MRAKEHARKYLLRAAIRVLLYALVKVSLFFLLFIAACTAQVAGAQDLRPVEPAPLVLLPAQQELGAAYAQHVTAQKAADRVGYYAPPPLIFPAGSRAMERLWEAVRTYKRTGRAPIIEVEGTKVLPYGKGDPTIETIVRHFTTFQLAPGEHVTGKIALGDKDSWSHVILKAGRSGRYTQAVLVEPKRCGVTANLVIPTNRGRIYRVDLVSAECDLEEGAFPTEYTDHVRWWYPDGRIDYTPTGAFASAAPAEEKAMRLPMPWQPIKETKAGGSTNGALKGPLLSGDINTDYEIDADRRFPCVPSDVVDDGEKMYIYLPEDNPLCRAVYPLYAERGRTLHLINYTVPGGKDGGHVYVVEGTPVKTVIMYRTPRGRQRRVEITNKRLQEALRRR